MGISDAVFGASYIGKKPAANLSSMVHADPRLYPNGFWITACGFGIVSEPTNGFLCSFAGRPYRLPSVGNTSYPF